LLILPVLTLTCVELGYVARMTRASLVEVMDSAYIRTAIVKGMPYHRVVIRHAIRNALMAPITIIMLHVNWLVGGLVVTEVIFGYPGLGKFIYDAAIFGDFNSIEAAAMVTVLIAVVTRLIGDLAYTLLNPRIRYS
jgi:peptide/nickel transport system permease protein